MLERVLSMLPDVSLTQYDFLDSSFFRTEDDGAPIHRRLPSPQEVLDASGVPSGYDGVRHFPEFEGPGLLVKFGHPSRVSLEEALALRSTRDSGHESNFIYMSFLLGQTLREVWETLSHEDNASVTQQLADIAGRLRSVELSSTIPFIGSLNQGPVQDIYFSPDQHKGPFTSPREFHDFVQYISEARNPLEDRDEDLFRPLLPDTARICLTHADPHLGNILVLRSPNGGRFGVSGIVDWAQAGWYPDYWEYCKAMIVGPYGDEWRDAGWLDKVLHPTEHELDAFEAVEQYWNSRCP
ncbi:uncharacterized protein B0T15DRAFT_487659 [Chaetomium strumarium]|uniref:Aminoglycoside phosphotransferase domain-containing protein n=1 Tax=Chaetomium strumarium TaxID=1170767 RepID=A0AAJ0GMC7_9PEZI|nr:hypothetical protein B0T15DRAFT_487659 [Chaetomium strumarium]